MTIFDVLSLLCGLALFLYGMDVMGDALKKSAGNSLKATLGKMTSSPFKGFLLGLGVTAVIQSSSATTVMVVGFVNSGIMTLTQSVGVIMGANVGTAVTAWITALNGIGAESGAEGALNAISWLKPSAWMPILAVIGICLLMFAKRGKKKDIGVILLGFAVLMVGMDLMGDATSGLKDQEWFVALFTAFSDYPILGVLAGVILTAIVQSSSASVGILQTLTLGGAVSFGAAVPIIMGQNIGTCVTALISSAGANKNGKRAAMIHLYFNIIGVIIFLPLFYLFNSIMTNFADTAIISHAIDMWGVAGMHTIFKIVSVILLCPFYRQLEKLAVLTIRDKKGESEETSLLDERLFRTPSVAVDRARQVTNAMAEISCTALQRSLSLFESYDAKVCDEIRALENKADKMEDALGSYLVKLSSYDMSEGDSHQVTKHLHLIGDLERISDHAVNIVESAEEMRDKKFEFSPEAQRELKVMRSAISEILNITYDALVKNDASGAIMVEPLEEVIDDIRDQIKANHVLRLRKSQCTIEHGFILSDLLTNFERVSDHCANIAACVTEISMYDALDMHKLTNFMKEDNSFFDEKYAEYKAKYVI